ncbi:MAG: hypothetical protein R2752_09220 [Vicinamibacterales bacterium]
MGRVIGLLLAGCAVYVLFFNTPPGDVRQTNFDPVQMARLEREVWEANNRKETINLFFKVVQQLRAQHHYTWAKAIDAGFHRARVIAAFRQTRTHLEQLLPDLERVYRIERDWYEADFDPKAVATAELSAWISMRRPELSNEQYVGSLFAERDGLRYELPPTVVSGPAQLAARAALMTERTPPDWAAIGVTLRESYGTLHSIVTQQVMHASK